MHGCHHGRRNYKDTNSKLSSLLAFLFLGRCSNFVGSESGQKQSVKLLQNMVYNTTQHPTTHPHPRHTATHNHEKGAVVGEIREKVEGQRFTRGSTIPK
jgi:hypothetical protein